MQAIPAIDLLNGNVVRLKKGEYDNPTIYDKDPLNTAKKFKDAGFDYIHVVDLNGAKDGEFLNLHIIQQMVEELGIGIQTGGGIRTYTDAEKLIQAGIKRVVISSMAFKNESDWLRTLRRHPESSILGMDLKDGKIAYGGWLQTTDIPRDEYLNKMKQEGLKYVLCTDISRDGMLSGTNIKLYRELSSAHPELNFIASGGVSGIKDLENLDQLNIWGVLIGRAYYEGKISLEEMMKFNAVQ